MFGYGKKFTNSVGRGVNLATIDLQQRQKADFEIGESLVIKCRIGTKSKFICQMLATRKVPANFCSLFYLTFTLQSAQHFLSNTQHFYSITLTNEMLR